MHTLDLCVWGHTGSFKPVNHQAARIGFQIEQMPVEGGDFYASAVDCSSIVIKRLRTILSNSV